MPLLYRHRVPKFAGHIDVLVQQQSVFDLVHVVVQVKKSDASHAIQSQRLHS